MTTFEYCRFVISQEYGPSEDVIQLLTRFIGGTTSEIHVIKLFLYMSNNIFNHRLNFPLSTSNSNYFSIKSMIELYFFFHAGGIYHYYDRI